MTLARAAACSWSKGMSSSRIFSTPCERTKRQWGEVEVDVGEGQRPLPVSLSLSRLRARSPNPPLSPWPPARPPAQAAPLASSAPQFQAGQGLGLQTTGKPARDRASAARPAGPRRHPPMLAGRRRGRDSPLAVPRTGAPSLRARPGRPGAATATSWLAHPALGVSHSHITLMGWVRHCAAAGGRRWPRGIRLRAGGGGGGRGFPRPTGPPFRAPSTLLPLHSHPPSIPGAC